METTDGNIVEENQTTEFLTAPQLVSLRKPDEDSTRCVVGEKYCTRSDTWLENKAVECALENFKDIINQKRAARICDLMQAEWNEEQNVSITTKLKGKFVQHMGRAFDGKIALSPEESVFLLENGIIEILNGKTPVSTEEAYEIMLKGNLSVEKYQVYSQLSQLGFIVVPHQTELGVTKYEKQINLDKHQPIKKRKIMSDACGEPESKRLTFTGAFSNKPVIDSADQENPSTSITSDSLPELEMPSRDESVSSAHSRVDDLIKESDDSVIRAEQIVEVIENVSNTITNSATIVMEVEEFKDASSNAVDTPVTNHQTVEETVCQTLPLDTLNEVNASIDCNKSSEISKRIEVELETVEVGPNDEISVQQEDAGSQSGYDTNSNPVPPNYRIEAPSGLSKNSIDVMNIDSQNTEISCTSEVLKDGSELNVSNSNVNVTLEDSSCSVMDAVELADDRDSNSDIMSCSSDNDDVLSVGVQSELSSENSQEDDEIKLLAVTKRETKPLAVIDLFSDEDQKEEMHSEYSSSDDEIQVLKVCNGVQSNSKSNHLESKFGSSYKFKKEERRSPVSYDNRNNVLQLSFPNCSRKGMICVVRPPVKYLPPNVCLSKEAYVINLKSQSEQSQPQNRLWNSYRDLQDYQRSLRRNRRADQSFQSRESSRSQGSFSSRDFRQNFINRRADSSENHEPNPWADASSQRDARPKLNYRRIDPPEISTWQDPPPTRDNKQNVNHRTNSPEVFSNFPNADPNPWLDGLPRGQGQHVMNTRGMDSSGNYTYRNYCNPYNSSQNLHQNPFGYPVPNTAAAINSVVSVSNQDMNVSMVGNHILHPPQHSSSSHLPSFNGNLPNLSAIGPVDIMAEVQRTAYTVATGMISSLFGQNMNPRAMAHMPPFNAFPPVQNNPFSFPPPFNAFFNSQNYSSEQFSMLNRHPPRESFRRHHTGNPFPCQYRNLRNRRSWNEVKEAVGNQDSLVDVGSDVEEVPVSPTDVLWDQKNVCPLIKPGTKYPISEVLKKLQVTQRANLLSNSYSSKACLPTTCSLEISFDVYLPGTNYKKTCPDIPKHRIIVARSTDQVAKYSDIAFLQKKWNDGAVLHLAVVDNGDISYQSFNNVCLPVLIPHEK